VGAPPRMRVTLAAPTTPYYYRVDVLITFNSPDAAAVTVEQSLYGDLAISLRQSIESVGEEVYLDSVSSIIKSEVGNRTLIAGKYDFALDGDPKVRVQYAGGELPLAKITIDLTLRGVESPEGTKAMMYQMDSDHPWLYQLYTQPILVRLGNTSAVVPIHELNLTVILPPGYCVETGGPRATSVKLLGDYPNQRVVLNWHVTNPRVESRGTSTGSFGPLYFILDTPDESTASRLGEIQSTIQRSALSSEEAERLLADLGSARETLLEFCSVNQTLLDSLEARASGSTGGGAGTLPVWAASIGVAALLLAASALLLRRR